MVYFLLASCLISCLITSPYVMSRIFAMHHRTAVVLLGNININIISLIITMTAIILMIIMITIV